MIIACHTEARWDSLLRAIASAQGQDPRPAEIIVAVDQNDQLARRLTAEVEGIKVVHHRGVRGASAARNTGAAAADSPLLVFLDDDVQAGEGWLRELLAPFADPRVVGTGGKTLPGWRELPPRWFPNEFGWVVGASYAGLPASAAPVRNVWSENMALRRDAFDAVGGFRVGFGKVGLTSLTEDDTDLCIRVNAAANGGLWMYVPTAKAVHDIPPERSTFRFYLRRSYLEGAGKVRMSALLGSSRDLGTEHRYVLGLPAAIGRHAIRGHLPRALAIIAGLVAAGLGAIAAAAPAAATRLRRGDAAGAQA